MWIAGVDGCPAGWVAVFARHDGTEPARVRVIASIVEVLEARESPAVVAVDMPIGLTDRTQGPGRVPEQHVRGILGRRQSSVFSMPSRAAVYAPDFARACALARASSQPAKAVSVQGFNLFPKVRELDLLLRSRPALAARVYEVHPEVAFWSMNGERALGLAKKVRNRPSAPGLALRRELLIKAGLDANLVQSAPPGGAAPDDFLDALAALVVARAIAQGRARPFPDPPDRDPHGLPIAIWTTRS